MIGFPHEYFGELPGGLALSNPTVGRELSLSN